MFGMRNPNREFIAIGFNNDDANIMPIIKMDGTGGLKKVIRGVSKIEKIGVYYINFGNHTIVNIGNIRWSESIVQSDVVITYKPEEEIGDVRIIKSGEVWSYSLEGYFNRGEQPLAPEEEKTEKESDFKISDTVTTIVDKNKVRQIEQKKKSRTLWPDELAEELKRDIYGQDEAIKKISELISANLRRKTPEVEVIVLFGPTGVGKTEVGKKLPVALERLTGQVYGFQQIALNEFVGEHSINRFFGAPSSYIGYGDPTIFEPVRSNAYQVYLLDEIEKATDRIWTGLMECFSSGVVRLADNSPAIDLSHVIFIITSNIPIDMRAYNEASSFRKKEICRDTLAKVCGHPEIAGKITNCIAFQSLPLDALTDIVSKFVIQELQNYGMKLEHMDETLMVQLKEQHSNYGARGVKDVVREALTTATIYDRDIGKYKGKKVRLSGDIEDIKITIISG